MPTLYDRDIENAWLNATQTLITRQNLIDHVLIQHTLTRRITVNTDAILTIEYTNGTIISPRSR